MIYCTYDTNCRNPIIIEKLAEENKQLKQKIEKMKNHTNCKFFHEWNLANVMEEPLDTLSPCQGCKDFNKWELAE